MANNNWSYVNKSDYQPAKNQIDSLIKQAQAILRPQGLTFQVHAIGSGRRKMITYQKGSNKGFDFDYNLELQYVPGNNPKQIKNMVREAFRQVLKKTKYNDPEDSTSVLTVKMVDERNSRIIHSFDLALVYYDNDHHLHYIHKDRNGNYSFCDRGYRFDDTACVKEIKEFYVDGWELIRDEYLKLKNNNNGPNKRSFSLYVESVRNVYEQMRHHSEYRGPDDGLLYYMR